MEENFRRRARRRLLRSPFCRLLIYEKWFRVVFFGLSSFFLILSFCIPRIWRTSPDGIAPVIRVSLFDLAQSWSLQRTARQAMADGRTGHAHYAWMAALANNPGDATALRGGLENYLQAPGDLRAEPAIQQAYWLLELTRTNHRDLKLACDVLWKSEHDELLISLINATLAGPEAAAAGATQVAAPRPEHGPHFQSLFLKALFRSGQLDAFARARESAGTAVGADPELELYCAAYDYGWRQQSAALERLTHPSAPDRPLRVRLLMAASLNRLDFDRYETALEELCLLKADRLSDHLGLWTHWARNGERDRAGRAAKESQVQPRSIREAAQLASFFQECNDLEQAVRVLKQAAGRFGDSPVLWVIYGMFLLEEKQWNDLQRVAYQIRDRRTVRDSLAAFSYFLEGQAHLALQRSNSADAAFNQMLQWPFKPPGVGLAAARQLLDAGQADFARRLLDPLSEALGQNPAYWQLLFRTGHLQRDEDLMLAASKRAFALTPRDPVAANCLAVSLIVQRSSSDALIGLTLPLATQFPASVAAQMNHSAALLLNRRFAEAHDILHRVSRNALSPQEQAFYDLHLFEIQKNLGLTRAEPPSIDRQLLFPSQVQWFDQLTASINAESD